MSSLALVSRAKIPGPIPSQCLPNLFSPLETRLTMGPQIFGNNAAWLLLGFISMQTYTYYRHSGRKHLGLNILVYSLVILVTGKRAVSLFVAYSYLVLGWGNPLVFTSVDGTIVANNAKTIVDDLQPVFVALLAIFVQFFFTWRIWSFCMAVYGRRMRKVVAAICFFIVCTSVCGLVSAITFSGVVISPVSYPGFLGYRLVLIWSLSTAVADVTITAIMIRILYHAKSSTYFGVTRDKLSRLLRLTLQTGFLTAILALPIGPLYAIYQDTSSIFDITSYVLGESYVISLLANLNARSHNPTSPDHARGIDNVTIPHVSTLNFAAGPPQNRDSNWEPSTGTGILSFIRSVAHTIHRDLTETPAEHSSRMEREITRLPSRGREVLENNHATDGSTEEVQAI